MPVWRAKPSGYVATLGEDARPSEEEILEAAEALAARLAAGAGASISKDPKTMSFQEQLRMEIEQNSGWKEPMGILEAARKAEDDAKKADEAARQKEEAAKAEKAKSEEAPSTAAAGGLVLRSRSRSRNRKERRKSPGRPLGMGETLQEELRREQERNRFREREISRERKEKERKKDELGSLVTDLMTREAAAPEDPRHRRRQPSCKVFAGNLPPKVTKRQLQYVFQNYGQVVNIFQVLRPGAPDSCAIVEYTSQQEANTAILSLHGKYKMTNKPLERAIVVRWALAH